ncbi:hypothetical protein DHW03_16580 [Pedobacter yonginense]|uniref:Nucleotide-diphospho-sugar transferase domain-containing protein n=1 Tax=Pedobacter yonginense TaxID=651869 RepID=A0A317EM94_9SPHI|nr:hypothetical protein [Pedobacter yonginense]PWS26396.1 hypothetical protein DHW03_16580 [Pedobacter yonginense]
MNKNVLSIAMGKKLYLDLAVNLARSFWYWNAKQDISFYLVTDMAHFLPADIREFTKIIEVENDALGKGFTPKLYLDQLAPDGQTLFIDSDCLVYGNLTPVFEKFQNHQVSVIGNYIDTGEWFGNIDHICRQFNVLRLPKFNGGVYYLENGEAAARVYQTARELEMKYDEIGFVRLRNRPNDEVLMALAMALHKQVPIAEDGSIMAEFVNFKSGVRSNLLEGKVILYNTPTRKSYQKSWPLEKAEPLIVHYLGHYNLLYPYIKEVKILQLLAKGYHQQLAKLITLFGVSTPYFIKLWLTNIFRPVYRFLFGFRAVAKSERIID